MNAAIAASAGLIERLAYSVDEAAKTTAIGRSTLYREMAAGRLRFRKIGDRRLILRADLLSWLSAQGGAGDGETPQAA